MKTRMKLITLGAATALAAGIGTYAFSASSDEGGLGSSSMQGKAPGMMMGKSSGTMDGGPGAMGMGSGMMGMTHDSATMAQFGAMHELFLNHDKVTRTVTNLPDGIRTVTESSDPRVAQLLKDHVGDMVKRVGANNYDKIVTKVETTDKGVVVVQTSTDPETVAALQQHASEVTDFAQDGMVAMRTVMMKNMGGMMFRGMPGDMMGGAPDDAAAPPAQ